MIFLRQKQFNNPRNLSSHRSRSRTHNQRQLQHLQITRQNIIYLNHNNNRPRRTTRSNNTQHDEIIRSVALNEKLASIGGLFGAVNIIITGALLYSIFTAKPEERWWYISGVIINISLLIILMLSAILFDRYYLKRYSSNHIPVSSSVQNRIIDANPTLLQYPRDCRFPMNTSDVPPQYPGYLDESNPVKTENETAPNSRLIYTDINNYNSNSRFLNNYNISSNGSNEIKNDNLEAHTCNDSKAQLPPNYFDLYPADANNNSISIPSTSTFTTLTNVPANSTTK